MSIRLVTVFGGTGFLGRRVVRHLREHEFSVRIASRHPDRSRKLFGCDDPCLQSVEADIRDERRVADVLAGTHAAVNAVSLYVERGQETFHSVHVGSAPTMALVSPAPVICRNGLKDDICNQLIWAAYDRFGSCVDGA